MNTASVIPFLNVASLVTIMLATGLTVNLEVVGTSLKRVWLVVLGLAANFFLVPLVTVALLTAFQSDPLVSAGFLILAVCPGAPLGPVLTHVARADVSLATGMMVLLAGLSVVTSPLLLDLLLAWVAPESNVSIDNRAMLVTLMLTQMLPLAIGLAVHKRAPTIAQRLAHPVRAIGNVLLLALLGAILLSQYETLFAIRSQAWLAMSALLLTSLAIGWFSGGRDATTRKAMSLTTGTRNVAVGLVIAGCSLAGTPAVTAVVAYGLISTLGALASAILWGQVAKVHTAKATS
jgi:BASS family bile acid:Na+ symporter